MEQRRDEPASVASFPTEHHSLLENDERPDPGPTPVDNSVNHCFLAEHPPVQVEVAEKQPSYQYWKEQFSHAQQSANQAQEEVEWLRRQVERWSL